MTKEKPIEIIQGVLKTEVDLSFLLQRKKSELDLLVAYIGERVDEAQD